MKKMLLAVFTFASLFVHSQTASVTLSKEFALRDRGLASQAGTTFRLGDNYYSMEYDYKGMQFAYTAKLDKIRYGINLYKYTTDMKQVQKSSLYNGKKELGPFPPKTVVFNKTIFLFYYQVQDDATIKLLVTTIDPETLAETATKELYIITEKNVGMFKMMDAVVGNKLSVAVSPDSTRLLVAQWGNTTELFTCIIGADNQVVKTRVTKYKPALRDATFQDIFLDNTENRYVSYTYTLGKLNKRGVLVLTNNGKDAWLDFNTGYKEWESNKLAFFYSGVSAKLYLYANYYGDFMDEGILLTTLNGDSLKFGGTQLFAYSADIKEKLNKLGFGSRNKDNYTVNRIDYTCNELEDGTLALTGYPSFAQSYTYTSGGGTTAIGTSIPSSSHTTTVTGAGPLVNAFLKAGKCNFGLLYRKQANTEASGFIPIAWKNTLVCIYCDYKKNLEFGSDDKVKAFGKPSNLVLVKAVIGSDGTVLSREEISGDPIGSNYYYLDYYHAFEKNGFIIPIGRERINMVRYFTEIVQWAELRVQ